MICKAIFGSLLAVGGYFIFNGVWSVLYPEVATLSEDAWWGARKPEEIKDDKIRPFTITTPDNVLARLKDRLNETRFPNAPLEGVNFEYGFNLNYLKTIRSYWLNNYNWNARLKFLNSLPHYKTVVSGLDIHFIHAKPSTTKSLKTVPILLLHSGLGSVREFYELIPLLTKPRLNHDFVFEVVAPSLPGSGFSEGAAIPGLGAAQTSVIFKKLMRKLGHEKFYVHGGDVGYFIGRDMSQLYPESVLGFHATMCHSKDLASLLMIALGSFYPHLIVEKEHEHKIYPIFNQIKFAWLELGFLHIQATKPDTIGTVLLDSPLGLAAYILETYAIGTNPAHENLPDGGLTQKFRLDALLDNIMIYWTTDSILTAVRLCSDSFGTKYRALGFEYGFIKVPTVCAQFPHEVIYTPEMILKWRYKNLVNISYFKEGGHFPSFELPNIVASDIWSSIQLFDEARKNAKFSV